MKTPIEPTTAALFGNQTSQLESIQVTLFEDGEVADWAQLRVSEYVPKFEPHRSYGRTVLDPQFGREAGGFYMSHKCASCGSPWRRCMGHPGVFTPGTWPLLNPALETQLRAVLDCLAPTLPAEAPEGESGLLASYMPTPAARTRALHLIRLAPAAARLRMLRKLAKPRERGSRTNRFWRGASWVLNFCAGEAVVKEWNEEHQSQHHPLVHTLTGAHIYQLLGALTPLDLVTMGVNGGVSDLRGLLFRDVMVLPTPMRPTRNREGRACPHDYTSKYNKLITLCTPAATPAETRTRMGDAALAMAIMLWPKALKRRKANAAAAKRLEQATKSIGESFGSKNGEIRGTVLGKRASNCARTNITPDCYLRGWEVGVPDEIADSLLVAMPVNPATRARAAAAADARGAYRSLTEQHVPRIALNNEGAPQEDGDIVLRPLEDGDVVLLNRQPTMSNQSMFSMVVRRMPGPTIRVPVDLAVTFHADFDGDEMNLFLPSQEETATEAANLAALDEGLLSYGNNRPALGCHQDALLGLNLMTKPTTELTRSDMLRLMGAIGHCKLPSSTSAVPGMWRGADALQPVLEGLGPMVRWEGPGGVAVRHGRLFGGPLQKAHVGSAENGLIHYVKRTLQNGRVALEMAYKFGVLAHEFLQFRPLCMNGDDLLLGADSPPAPPSEGLTDRYNAAEKETSRIDYVSAMTVEALERRVGAPLRAGYTNAFVCLVKEAGSKGSIGNLYQQFGALGQQTVSGARIKVVSCGRTLAVYPQNTNTPESRGYVARSLVDGLDIAGAFFHTSAAREGLIINKRFTPSNGYAQRRIIACMKNCVVRHDGTVRGESGVVQYSYGGDGSSPDRSVKCKFEKGEINAALAEGVPEWAVSAVRDAASASGVTGQEEFSLHLPVAVTWLLMRYAAEGTAVAPPTTAWLEERLNRMRPWHPSELTRAVIMVKLRPSAVCALGLTAPALEELLDALLEDWDRSRIAYGTPVGILVGTSVGPPATQSCLDAFHVAGMATSTNSSADKESKMLTWLLNCSEPKMGTKGMIVRLMNPTKQAAHRLAFTLPAVLLKTVISGQPVAASAIEQCSAKAQVLWAARLTVTGGTTPVGAAFVTIPLSSRALAAAALTPANVAARLHSLHRRPVECWHGGGDPFLLLCCTDERQAAGVAKNIARHRTCVSGVPRISSAEVRQDRNGEWYVETSGTDMAAVLLYPEVDRRRTRSRCVQDTFNTLGCEAAATAAYEELRRLLGGNYVNKRHLMLFADFMLSTGKPLAMSRHGMAHSSTGPISRAMYETPMMTLTDAAMRGENDRLNTFSSQIFVGNTLKVGVGCTDVLVDLDAACTTQQREGCYKYMRAAVATS